MSSFWPPHRRFYAPSNALIFLDGAVDLDTVLRVLDEEYLSSFARSERTVFPPLQAPVDGGVQRIVYEVASEAEEPGRTRLGYGFVLGSYADRETLVAAGVLAQVLAGDNESPLCRAVLSPPVGPGPDAAGVRQRGPALAANGDHRPQHRKRGRCRAGGF